MILDGERRGLLTKDKTIVDATSGNTGIGLRHDRRRSAGYACETRPPKNASPSETKPHRLRRRDGV